MDIVSLLVNILIFMLVVGLILFILDYAGRMIPGLPPAFIRIAQAVIVVVALIWFLKLVLGSAGTIGAIKVGMALTPIFG